MKSRSYLDPPIHIMAHRGDSLHAPENTFTAFDLALAKGADAIECDIHLSADGTPIISHDPLLLGTYAIKKLKDDEIAELDAGSAFTDREGNSHPFQGKGIKFATLEGALRNYPTARFNVDLKDKGQKIIDRFVEIVKAERAEARVLGTSFHAKTIKALRKAIPDLATSLSWEELLAFILSDAHAPLPPHAIIQMPYTYKGMVLASAKFCKKAHERGATIMVWTINDKEQAEKAYQDGVDAIITDNMDIFIS